jgi:hypothetical protein
VKSCGLISWAVLAATVLSWPVQTQPCQSTVVMPHSLVR